MASLRGRGDHNDTGTLILSLRGAKRRSNLDFFTNTAVPIIPSPKNVFSRVKPAYSGGYEMASKTKRGDLRIFVCSEYEDN